MWPLPTGLIVRIGAAVAVIAAVWVYGFSVGIARGNLKAEKEKVEGLQIKEQQTAELAKTIQESRIKYEKAITILNGINDSYATRLRDRPARYLPGAAPIGRNCIAATGIELAREDATIAWGSPEMDSKTVSRSQPVTKEKKPTGKK